jgi:hypothetical protein
MTTLLSPKPVSTRQFTWVPETREYVAEISSTHGFGQVYDDACDEGLTLVSARTGNTIVFVVQETHRDGAGEIAWWVLKPAHGRSGLDATITLFND